MLFTFTQQEERKFNSSSAMAGHREFNNVGFGFICKWLEIYHASQTRNLSQLTEIGPYETATTYCNSLKYKPRKWWKHGTVFAFGGGFAMLLHSLSIPYVYDNSDNSFNLSLKSLSYTHNFVTFSSRQLATSEFLQIVCNHSLTTFRHLQQEG